MPSKDAGRVARLFVLGTLESTGPAHGHEIRRLAERIDVENWSDAHVGSIYNAIRRLEIEGLIEPIRNEQLGRRPPRTVYALTDAGRPADGDDHLPGHHGRHLPVRVSGPRACRYGHAGHARRDRLSLTYSHIGI